MAKKLKALLALMLTLVMVLYMWPVGVAANEQALSDTLQAGEDQTVELPQVLPELDNGESNGGPVVLPELDNGENNGGPVVLPELDNGENNGGPVVLPELDNGAANGILGEDDEESIYTCSTVSDPADGTVTVEKNKTPTIHFASTYTKVEQPPAEPAQLIITKTIHGIDKLPDSFHIEIEGATKHTLDTTTASHVDNVYTWKVALPEGEYTVEETSYAVEGYSVTPCVDNKENCAKSIVAMPDDYNISIHFTNTYTKNEQPTEKAPVLEIEKTANVSSMTVGSQVTYTITVSNTGDAQATDVTVTDILPDGLSYVSSTNGGIHSNGMITWDLGVLNAGDSRVMTVTAQAEKTGSLVNTAEVDCNELTVITDEATVSVTTSGGGGGGPVTPDPDPDEEVDITDPETPLGPGPDEEVEIPEEETPLAPNPDEEVEIGDEETPLAPAPEETVIDDAQVPLATLPQTGAIGMKLDPAMAAGALILAAALTAAGVTVTKTSGKKKED